MLSLAWKQRHVWCTMRVKGTEEETDVVREALRKEVGMDWQAGSVVAILAEGPGLTFSTHMGSLRKVFKDSSSAFLPFYHFLKIKANLHVNEIDVLVYFSMDNYHMSKHLIKKKMSIIFSVFQNWLIF